MQYITTTDLRTKSSELVNSLSKGSTVSLMHRSRIIGEIKPVKKTKPFNAKEFKKLVDNLNLPQTTYSERDRIYKRHLMKKYGKDIS